MPLAFTQEDFLVINIINLLIVRNRIILQTQNVRVVSVLIHSCKFICLLFTHHYIMLKNQFSCHEDLQQAN